MDVDNSFQTSYSVSGHPSAISGLSLNKKFEVLSSQLESKNPLELVTTLIQIVESIKDRNGPREFVNSNISSKIIQLGRKYLKKDEKVIFQVIAILTHISKGCDENRKVLKDDGALDLFRAALEHSLDTVRQMACTSLNLYCLASTANRNEILELETVSQLIEMIQTNPKEKELGAIVFLLSSLCHGSPPPFADFFVPSIPILASLILHPDDEVRLKTILGIEQMVHFALDEELMAISLPQIIASLINRLNSNDASKVELLGALLTAIHSFCAASPKALKLAVENGLTPLLENFTSHQRLYVRLPATKLQKLLS